MSGDWIKMRSDLFTHPKVVRISSALKADTLRTVGGLMSAWCLFDAHSVDGVLEGYTAQALDDHLRWPGFAREMVLVSWLVDCGESLELPRFDTHNGQSAKRRAQDSERKRNDRKTSASEADKSRTREENRREYVKSKPRTAKPVADPSMFEEFWSAYPKKVAKADAEKAFAKLAVDAGLLLTICESVKRQSGSWDDLKFAPNPATWLNGKRWLDTVTTPKSTSSMPEYMVGAL